MVTMESLDGLNGLSTVKKPEELADSLLGSDRCREVNEMEEAAHAEELCKVREEKAELKVGVVTSRVIGRLSANGFIQSVGRGGLLEAYTSKIKATGPF